MFPRAELRIPPVRTRFEISLKLTKISAGIAFHNCLCALRKLAAYRNSAKEEGITRCFGCDKYINGWMEKDEYV